MKVRQWTRRTYRCLWNMIRMMHDCTWIIIKISLIFSAQSRDGMLSRNTSGSGSLSGTRSWTRAKDTVAKVIFAANIRNAASRIGQMQAKIEEKRKKKTKNKQKWIRYPAHKKTRFMRKSEHFWQNVNTLHHSCTSNQQSSDCVAWIKYGSCMFLIRIYHSLLCDCGYGIK